LATCLAGAIVAAVTLPPFVVPAHASGSFRFPEPAMQVSESQALVRVVVERTDLPVSRATVDYRTESATALEGEDFVAGAGRLVFDVGVSQATFVVYLLDDDVAEEREHLVVQLFGSSSAAATITIFDDDRTVVVAGAADGGAPASTPPAAPATSATPASGSAAPRPEAVRRRLVATRPVTPSPRRVTVRQSPVTPFELRPAPGASGGSVPGAVDPALALLAGLLLAKVGAEVWFRARTAAS
jgi:hypothetical protein